MFHGGMVGVGGVSDVFGVSELGTVKSEHHHLFDLKTSFFYHVSLNISKTGGI